MRSGGMPFRAASFGNLTEPRMHFAAMGSGICHSGCEGRPVLIVHAAVHLKMRSNEILEFEKIVSTELHL